MVFSGLDILLRLTHSRASSAALSKDPAGKSFDMLPASTCAPFSRRKTSSLPRNIFIAHSWVVIILKRVYHIRQTQGWSFVFFSVEYNNVPFEKEIDDE